jgi:hypothetical protein
MLEARYAVEKTHADKFSWSDIAIRLLCTIVAGGLIGYNRTRPSRWAANNHAGGFGGMPGADSGKPSLANRWKAREFLS